MKQSLAFILALTSVTGALADSNSTKYVLNHGSTYVGFEVDGCNVKLTSMDRHTTVHSMSDLSQAMSLAQKEFNSVQDKAGITLISSGIATFIAANALMITRCPALAKVPLAPVGAAMVSGLTGVGSGAAVSAIAGRQSRLAMDAQDTISEVRQPNSPKVVRLTNINQMNDQVLALRKYLALVKPVEADKALIDAEESQYNAHYINVNE